MIVELWFFFSFLICNTLKVYRLKPFSTAVQFISPRAKKSSIRIFLLKKVQQQILLNNPCFYSIAGYPLELTSDGKVPVGMVQLKVNGKQCMAKESDYLAYKEKMNTKYGMKQAGPKSFYQKALNSKGMKICSRISKAFGSASYMYDYITDISMMIFYFNSCHENSWLYGTVSSGLILFSLIYPNMIRGKKKIDCSFFKEFLMINFNEVVRGRDPTPEQKKMVHDIRFTTAVYESIPQYFLNIYTMLRHGMTNPALQISSLLGSMFGIWKAFSTRHALMYYKDYPSLEQIIKSAIVNMLPMFTEFYTDFVFLAALFEIEFLVCCGIMYTMANCCIFCCRCCKTNANDCSERLLEIGADHDDHESCCFRLTVNRELFLKSLFKAVFATYYMKGFFQKPYEYVWVLQGDKLPEDNYFSKVNYAYFSSFDDCDTEEHEPNFPPLADYFLGFCIFLWILLAINLVYFLIEKSYYRRNQKEFVYINHFINRGIKSRAALECEKRLEQKRKDRLEANQGLPEDGLTTA